MSLQTVARAQWPRVLERFSREHRAWLATVFEVHGDVQATRVEARPLRAIELQEPGGLAIQFADGSPEVRIESPRASARPEALDGLAPAER